jgi:hydrogenase expression/formation protein HypC
MCLAVPGRVTQKYEKEGLAMGKVDFGGVTKEVCLAYVPEIEIGRYTIVHVGFAISEVDEKTAQETLELFQQMGVLDEELGMADAPSARESLPNEPSSSSEFQQ